MEAAIVTTPEAAPIIRGTGGIRKLRWAGSGRGKRGDIRAIYLWHVGAEAVYMPTAYAKADRKALVRAAEATCNPACRPTGGGPARWTANNSPMPRWRNGSRAVTPADHG